MKLVSKRFLRVKRSDIFKLYEGSDKVYNATSTLHIISTRAPLLDNDPITDPQRYLTRSWAHSATILILVILPLARQNWYFFTCRLMNCSVFTDCLLAKFRYTTSLSLLLRQSHNDLWCTASPDQCFRISFEATSSSLLSPQEYVCFVVLISHNPSQK